MSFALSDACVLPIYGLIMPTLDLVYRNDFLFGHEFQMQK